MTAGMISGMFYIMPEKTVPFPAKSCGNGWNLFDILQETEVLEKKNPSGIGKGMQLFLFCVFSFLRSVYE